MSTHNIQFHDIKRKKKRKYLFSFLKLSEEFRRDSENEFELAMVNEPSVFELLRSTVQWPSPCLPKIVSLHFLASLWGWGGVGWGVTRIH